MIVMKCSICGKEYTSETWLLKHMSEHEGVTLCPKCGKLVPDARGCVYCGEPLDSLLKELKK